jgi:hypothetical protein
MKNKLIVTGLLLVCIAMLSLIGWMLLNPRIGDSTVNQSRIDGSVKQVVDYIKEHAHDPESYESVSWDTLYLTRGGAFKYSIKHKFRIKNGFGALRLTHIEFFIDSSGKVVATEDIPVE